MEQCNYYRTARDIEVGWTSHKNPNIASCHLFKANMNN